MRILLLFLLLSNIVFAQKCDTIIKNEAYTSYFSKKYQQPIQVTYILYKGGGDCSRSGFYFKNDTKLEMIDKEYTGLGYDRGHLANAEDFASDCKKDELTFRYYNCLPQTPNLNRGIWKVWETKIRDQSQTDSLLVLTGGIWTTPIVVNKVLIPNNCWKVVYSLKTKKVLYVLLFTNTMADNKCIVITLKELEKMLKYKLKFK